MTKLELLFCPECKHATMQLHPSADEHKETPYNDLYKCNFCGYTECITTHEERSDNV